MSAQDGSDMGVESRQQRRSSLFLAAVLRSETEQVPARVRNMSLKGAMVEAPICPPKGTKVQLIRGSLIAHGEVMWTEGGQCGLRFASDVSVKDWLAAPSKVEQQRVDEIVSLVKAGAIPAEFGGARPEGSELQAEDRAVSELEQVVALLLSLEDDLAASNETLQRHAPMLQNLDIAVQMLRAIANKLAGTVHDGAALQDLRVVCAEALAKGLRRS